MAITAGITDSFRQEMLQEGHDLSSDVLKIALYTSNATLDKSTTEYSATDEVNGTGYVAGGLALSGVTISLQNNVVFVDFDNPSWAGATFSARGALIYNTNNANKSVAVLDFGQVISAAGETFELNLPPANSAEGLLRFA